MSVLLLAIPSHLQEALQNLLLPLAEVHVVERADRATVSAAIRSHQPKLLVLDYGYPHDWESVLAFMREEWPGIQTIVLVDTVQQRQRIQEKGGGVILVKGFPAAKLYSLVKQLLSQPPSTSLSSTHGCAEFKDG